MPEHTLARTGNRPLAFDGERIASVTSKSRDANRWHELALYRTAAGALVLAIGYRTQWEGESPHDEALQVKDAAEAADELRSYDPCAYLLGYPPGEHYAQKQARIALELRQRYEHAVSELLAALEPERIA